MINLKNYLFFLIYILVNPRLIILFFHHIYLPIFIQYEWLSRFEINTIIDVGAYHGNVFKSISVLFPRAKIYAFEPDIHNYNVIKSRYDLPNLTLSNLALSDKIGKSCFYTHPSSYLSSLLKIKKQNKEFKFFNEKTTKIYVKTTTLDKYFERKKLKGKIFLKIDTQGTEGLVLAGGKKFLKKVSIIHVETSFDKFYKNQDYFENIYNYLTKLGFKYLGEARESQFYPNFDLPKGANSIFINNHI